MMNVYTVDITNKNKIDKKFEGSYKKLQKITQSHYGGALLYRAFTTEPSKSEKTLQGLLAKNNPLSLGNKTMFPVFVDEQMTGFCEVETYKKMNSLGQKRIQNLIDLLLVHSIKNSRSLQKLQQSEKSLGEPQNTSSNVIYLKDYVHITAQKTPSLPEKYRLGSFKKDFNINLPCTVFSRDPEESFKMAREIHDQTDRFAFLRINDLDTKALEKEGLNSLGPVSIFIPELAALMSAEVRLIERFFASEARTKNSPLIIAATKYTLKNLNELQIINTDALKSLSLIQLNMKKNFTYYKRAGLMDFILDSMTKKNLDHLI